MSGSDRVRPDESPPRARNTGSEPGHPRRGDIGCDRARRLLDDYLEYRLSNRDQVRLEAHLSGCPACTQEARRRPALERQLSLALGTAVQPLRLSPEVGAQMVRSAQKNVRVGIWLNRALSVGQVVAGTASLLLLVVGLAYVLNQTVLPWTQKPLFEATDAPPAPVVWDAVLTPYDLEPGQTFAAVPAEPPADSQPLTYGLELAPGPLLSGEPFTTTVMIHNGQEEPLPLTQVNLDIEGPQQSYHFELAVSNPLPADRVSVLQITPEQLAQATRERYQVSPDQILSTPGLYTIRVTLFHPAIASDVR
jgi:Putative zinc-finger